MIDPVAIQLGPISIRWYAICIVTGLVLAVYLAMKEAPRRKIIPDDILDFILVAFPVAIVGARLYYVAFEWDYYGKNLIKIIDFWNSRDCHLRRADSWCYRSLFLLSEKVDSSS